MEITEISVREFFDGVYISFLVSYSLRGLDASICVPKTSPFLDVVIREVSGANDDTFVSITWQNGLTERHLLKDLPSYKSERRKPTAEEWATIQTQGALPYPGLSTKVKDSEN